jgi:hypothetical protein
VSFSALASYSECPFRFYLERILGLRLPEAAGEHDGEGGEVPALPEEAGEDEVGGREIGSLVHRCLELLPLSEPPLTEALRLAAEQATLESGLRLPGGKLEEVARLAGGFWRSPLAGLSGLAGAGKEVPFVFSHGGVLVNGVLDLLVREGSDWHVVDYKSNLVEQRDLEDLFRPYLLQAQIYALAALAAGAQTVRTSFLFLQRPEAPVQRAYAVGDRRLLEEALDQALSGLLEGRFPRGDGCAGCPPRSLCQALAGGEDRHREGTAAWTRLKGMV